MDDARIPDDANDLSRRALLRRGAAGAGAFLSLPAFLAACGSDSASTGASAAATTAENSAFTDLLAKTKSKQVIVASYGGDTEAARKKIFWDPFTKASGIKVVQADAGALGDQMLNGEIPTKWDAFHGSTAESLQAQLTGKKKLPTTPQAAWEDLVEKDFQPYMWQSFFVGYFPAYLTGTFTGDQPSTWADFFDVKKFPGKRSWPGKAYTSATREAALLGDGVAPADIYPLDLERADAKIKSIWDSFVFYDEFPQVQSYLTSKTVAISFGPNAMWKQLRDKGAKVSTLDGATPILEQNGMNILPDPPNLDAVQLLAVFCNDPARQAEFAKATNYGPPTKAAFDKLTDAEVQLLPNAPGRDVVVMDTKYLGKIQNDLIDDNKKLFS